MRSCQCSYRGSLVTTHPREVYEKIDEMDEDADEGIEDRDGERQETDLETQAVENDSQELKKAARDPPLKPYKFLLIYFQLTKA